jgi:transposase
MDDEKFYFQGTHGKLPINPDDKLAIRLAMLIEGECSSKAIGDVVSKYDISRGHYYKVLKKYIAEGSSGLIDQQRGPKTKSVRTEVVNNQIIRQQFLDPKATPEIIAQKITQTGWKISAKSVMRTIDEFGLKKKTL